MENGDRGMAVECRQDTDKGNNLKGENKIIRHRWKRYDGNSD